MTRWIRLVLGVGLLGLLLSKVDFRQLDLQWDSGLFGAAAATVVLLAMAQGLSALRWRLLLGTSAASWRYLFRLYLIAAFWSLFLPTAVGGDAVRAAAASRGVVDSGQAVGTVIADRVLGVVALVVYLAVGIALIGGPSGLGLGPFATGRMILWGGALLAGIALVALAFRRRLARLIDLGKRITAAFADLARNPRRLAAALVVGFGVQAVYLLAWIGLATGLGLEIPIESFLVTVPLVSLSTMAPITLSGVGVREGAWIVLLRPYGIAPANALALSLVYFGCWILVAGIGGVLFAIHGTAPSGRATSESQQTAPR